MPNISDSPKYLRLHAHDNVAVAIRPIAAGESLGGQGREGGLAPLEAIPPGHKFAVEEIPVGNAIKKFGWPIGRATQTIVPGQHVHCHNVRCDHQVDLDAIATEIPPTPEPLEAYFDGFVRPNGQVGTRNYIAVISSVNCSASVAKMIAEQFPSERLAEFPNVDGVISFRHDSGCAMAWEGTRHRMLTQVLGGMAKHPNIGGYVLVGLGCEQGTLQYLADSQRLVQIALPAGAKAGSDTGTAHIPMLTIQGSGGTRKTAEQGVELVQQLLPHVNQHRRQRVSAQNLTLATECGGSDGYSGITANPLLGRVADLVVAAGGTVVLSETPEIYGAEHLLTRRARTPAVAAHLLERLNWWREHFLHYGEEFDSNPSVGNKAGGLTTITEKSLGAVSKAGSTALEAVYEYANPIQHKGLVVMDTPGFDPASVTGMVAGGANLVAFTTGRGSCFGFKPAPSFKIASNSDLFHRLPDDMDFDAGKLIGGADPDELARQLFEELLATASGRPTCSERLGLGDEEFVPWLIGPVL